MNTAPTFIRQGGDLKFVFDRDGEDISDFICLIEVKQFPNGPVFISRIIPPVENTWPGLLSSTETSPLAVGLYWLIAKITNAQTDEERQVPERFQVIQAWV